VGPRPEREGERRGPLLVGLVYVGAPRDQQPCNRRVSLLAVPGKDDRGRLVAPRRPEVQVGSLFDQFRRQGSVPRVERPVEGVAGEVRVEIEVGAVLEKDLHRRPVVEVRGHCQGDDSSPLVCWGLAPWSRSIASVAGSPP